MKKDKTFLRWVAWLTVLFQHLFLPASANDTSYYSLASLGVRANTGKDITAVFNLALERIKKSRKAGKPVAIVFEPGRYDFFPEKAMLRELYVSNHDQDNPKTIGLLFEGWDNVSINGNGADLIFHGRMLPVAIRRVRNFALKDLHIDFEKPHICQVDIVSNDTINKVITFKTAPWVQYEVRDSVFYNQGNGWENQPASGIAFEKGSRHIVFNTGDVRVPVRRVTELSPGLIRAYNWDNKKLVPGTVLAMRSWKRPAPGIFLEHGRNVLLHKVRVHYAEGMGLLAQVSENITLHGFNVSLRDDNDPRYFTTQADATHFSGCKGTIISANGLYEGMMDDAINVHGTYLKIEKQIDDRTVLGKYMHGQSYGFEWGRVGDSIQFVASKTMELTGGIYRIRSIRSVDQPTYFGAKLFEISFDQPLSSDIRATKDLGIENITWTPEVYFGGNTVRNNRARGALFSTPKNTVVENNLFDHTSGSAILLCGDCNGWFETGACRSVLIQNNRFVNALTNMFQFTNAVISIYPEIPELNKQRKFFHSGVRIENNIFETFDRPLLYAKSVDGLAFIRNRVVANKAYPAFHWNKYPFWFERVVNYKITENNFGFDFDENKDIKKSGDY